MKNLQILCAFCVLAVWPAQKIFAVTNFVGAFGSQNANYFTIVQQAIDNSSAGDLVLVSNGVYNFGGGVTPDETSLNRIVITNNITVKSVNGPENTIILGKPDAETGNFGAGAVRCAYISDGKLIGFTFSNGFTRSFGSVYYDRSGGGLILDFNGSISNCIVVANSAEYYGGGIFFNKGGVFNHLRA